MESTLKVRSAGSAYWPMELSEGLGVGWQARSWMGGLGIG